MYRNTLKAMIKKHFAETAWVCGRRMPRLIQMEHLGCTEYELTKCRGEIDWVQVVCIAHWSCFLYSSAEPQFILC